MLMIDWLNIDMNRINFQLLTKKFFFFQSENLNNLKNKEFFYYLKLSS
jgi:hypothetical protein